MNTSHTDYMNLALEISEKGRLTAFPNPFVGCVLVNDGRIVGKGFHEKPGEPHAEINALKEAGSKAKHSVAYVTLEPCCHTGRTGPCVKALIDAQIKEVYLALKDPDPRVSGKGVKALQDAGIKVNVGLQKEHVEKSLQAYLHHRNTGLPYCILKTALSLDGKVAAADYSSKWISSETARKDAHYLRAESQAIMVGSETALKDKPKLTVRDIDLPRYFCQPKRILLDGRGRVSPSDYDTEMVFTTVATYLHQWQEKGTEVFVLPRMDLKEILNILGKKNFVQILVEGGAKLHSSFIQENLFRKIVLYLGSCWLGMNGIPFSTGLNIPSIDKCVKLKLIDIKKFDNDVRMDYQCLQES